MTNAAAVRYSWLLIAGLACSPLAAAADDGFAKCIAGLQERARAERLPVSVVDEVLARLEYQPRVLELDRKQPEFIRTFADYLNRRVTAARIEQGRRLWQEYRTFLSSLMAEYGIPGHYLVAFWGLETNFGGYLGTMPILDSLATLACDPRRSDYFTDELMTALLLLDRESLTAADMRGSWAGAMGHTQFMPSAYRRYAIDGDNDGRVDLWRSERDALASGANFLAQLGWRSGERWGREVLLPDDFPYAQSGLANRRPLAHWQALGVTQTDRSPLPDSDMSGAILVPAGHTGPAFLVYPNFEVIMRWNRSEFYALSVGLLADRIAGAGPLARSPSTDEPALGRRVVEVLQQRLNERGFDAGGVDGVMGSATRAALREFETSAGVTADGYPDPVTLELLAIDTAPENRRSDDTP